MYTLYVKDGLGWFKMGFFESKGAAAEEAYYDQNIPIWWDQIKDQDADSMLKLLNDEMQVYYTIRREI